MLLLSHQFMSDSFATPWMVALQAPLSMGLINLDSILKSRDITLSTRVYLVKAMAFPVVLYGCESWIIKRLRVKELMLLHCGVGEDS